MSNWIATLAGTGRLPVAPGTWGSLVGLLTGIAILLASNLIILMICTLVFTLIGWLATAQATKGKEDHDPSEIVIDELVGQWVALFPLAQGLWFTLGPDWFGPLISVMLPFALFRLFDILKPWPVSWADRQPTALGVMMDDLIAGAMAAACYVVLLLMVLV